MVRIPIYTQSAIEKKYSLHVLSKKKMSAAILKYFILGVEIQ